MMWLTISVRWSTPSVNSLLTTNDVSETITDFRAEVVNTLIDQFVPPELLEEQWDVKGLAVLPNVG